MNRKYTHLQNIKIWWTISNKQVPGIALRKQVETIVTSVNIK